MSFVQPVGGAEYFYDIQSLTVPEDDYTYQIQMIEDVTHEPDLFLTIGNNESFLAFGNSIFEGLGRLQFTYRGAWKCWNEYLPIVALMGIMLPLGWYQMMMSQNFSSVKSRRLSVKYSLKPKPSTGYFNPKFSYIKTLPSLMKGVRHMSETCQSAFKKLQSEETKEQFHRVKDRLKVVLSASKLSHQHELESKVEKNLELMGQVQKAIDLETPPRLMAVNHLEHILKRVKIWLDLAQKNQPCLRPLSSELSILGHMLQDESLAQKVASTDSFPVRMLGLHRIIQRMFDQASNLQKAITSGTDLVPILALSIHLGQLRQELPRYVLPKELEHIKQALVKDMARTEYVMGTVHEALLETQEDMSSLFYAFGQHPEQLVGFIKQSIDEMDVY